MLSSFRGAELEPEGGSGLLSRHGLSESSAPQLFSHRRSINFNTFISYSFQVLFLELLPRFIRREGDTPHAFECALRDVGDFHVFKKYGRG